MRCSWLFDFVGGCRALPTKSVLVSVVFSLVVGIPHASAQEDIRFAEEPTGGVFVPTVGISGAVDALSSVSNPAGLFFLDGWDLALALDAGLEENATGGGNGFGAYYGAVSGGGLLPRFGWGLSVEALRPPRIQLDPDPGEPVRLTYSTALGIGESAGFGVAWHHFFDSPTVGGLDTFDLGLAIRGGAYLGFGLVARDVNAPDAAGTPVQRRYEAEVAVRPLATDALELGLGGRVGETRGDIDGWLRGSLRLARGVYLRAEGQTRELQTIDTTATGSEFGQDREYRVTAGIEISFGNIGVAGYGTTSINDGTGSFQSSTVVVRLSERGIPSVLPTRKRLERIGLNGGVGQRSLTRVIAYLRALERDDDVEGVIVDLDGFAAGWATNHELRKGLARLKAKGKKVYAFMVSGTMAQYYLASVADKVFVDPAGGIRLQGLAATTLYFKGVFEKLGVQAQFEKIEEYKSAPEAWTRSGPSTAAFEMRNELYDSLYGVVVADIAADRKVPEKRIRELIDGGPYTAGDLEKIPELVDKVVTSDDMSKAIREDMGRTVGVGHRENVRSERWDYPGVAIIHINGDIVDGKSRTIPVLGRKLVGGDTIAAAIAQARADRSIKAIILRINSPGGSALASEIMAREVFKTREVKPIICSMGNVAASGGYFAAAGCDTILAGEMTITGSIGIFNGKFDVSGLLTRLGLSWTTYKRGENADAFSFYRPFTADERAMLKNKLRYFYGRFVGAVAEGRKMKKEEVDAVGRGHVWTGKQALPINLIDRIGGINEAIDEAKRRIGLGPDDRIQLVTLPKPKKNLISQLLNGNLPIGHFDIDGDLDIDLDTGAPAASDPAAAWRALLPGDIGGALADAIPASVWAQPDVAQARLPFAIIWD